MKKEHIRDHMPEKPAGAAAKRRWARLSAAAACLVLAAAALAAMLLVKSGWVKICLHLYYCINVLVQ